MIIDEYKSNAQNMIVNNFDYKVEHMILKFHRVVLRGLRSFKAYLNFEVNCDDKDFCDCSNI